MYDENTYRREYFDARFGRVRHESGIFGFLDGALVVFLAVVGIVVACLAGCAGDPATAAATLAANSKPGSVGFAGVGTNAPAVVAGVVAQSGWLTGLGAVALLAGVVICSHPKLPNEIGFGLAAGGLALLVAGYVLPLFAGWIGLAGVVAVSAWGLSRVDWPGLIARWKSIFTKTPTAPIA